MSINSGQSDVFNGDGPSQLSSHSPDLLVVNNILERNMRNVNGMSSSGQDWNPQAGRMSPARRTFCLFSTFDLILTFILWVIYTQLIGDTPIWTAFKNQVFNYSFETSLFDTVMIAAARFTFIMLAYALFRISHWWVIAISTTMTCVYLLSKCFLFDFNDRFLGGKNPLSYIILIVCFVLAWIETWMLDFKVIPSERKIMSDPERAPLLKRRHSSGNIEDTREYYSPFHTPAGSDDEGEIHTYHNAQTARSPGVRKDSESYGKLLEEAKEGLLEMLQMDGWNLEAGKTMEEGLVYSQHIKKFKKKIFKLEGIVNLPAQVLWEDMIKTLNDSPKWNPTILESRTLQIIDDHTEITYNISAEAAGGLVSARDFISLRHFTQLQDGTFISCGIGCTHQDMPVQKKYVRGENGPGGWHFEPFEGDNQRCKFTWIVNSNLKGWLPQAAIDQALSGVLLQYFQLLCAHYADFPSNSSPSIT